MPASSQPLEPSAGLTRFQISSKPSGAFPGASRTMPEKRTLAQCWSRSVASSSRSASTVTTSVCCCAGRSATSLRSSSNISCVVNSRISSSFPRSFATCRRTKFSLAERRNPAVSKPAGIFAVASLVGSLDDGASLDADAPMGGTTRMGSPSIPATLIAWGAASWRRAISALITNTAAKPRSARRRIPPNPLPPNMEPSKPPIASPPSIGSQRLKPLAGAGCCGAAPFCGAACCWAGFAGVDAGGAFVTLRWVPTDLPPPTLFASASVAARSAPASDTAITSSHLPIGKSLGVKPSILSKAVAAVQCDHTGGKVEIFHACKARGLQHPRELGLVRVHPDRFGEITVSRLVAGHALAQPGQDLEGVHVVGGLERLPDFGEFEHEEAPSALQHACHLGEREFLARHVPQPER